MKQVSQTPQRPSSINPRVSPALDGVVMRALEKEPGERFQNADAFIAALDVAVKDPGGAGTADFAALPPVVAAPVEEEREEEGRRRWLLWTLLAAAIAIGILVGLLLTRDTSTGVPKVTGNELNVAVALLQQDGFSVGEVKRVEREAPPNTVLEQDPAASPPGDQASLDCAFLSFFCSKPDVTLTVSSGPGIGKVPATAGIGRDEAAEKVEAAGFGVKVKTVNSSAVEEGLVIHSEPSAGESATNGTDVTLFVSAGPKLAKVPVLVGSQRRLAVQQIRGRGLLPSVSEEESGTAAGEVISQSPSAGSEVDPGSTVAIVVSAGKRQAKVPNVIGKLRPEAVQAVRDAGLEPSVEEEETAVQGKIGRAIDQFPPPGSELTPGESVTIVVGRPQAFSSEGEEEE
jgi:serine/threonine-protein kinase